MVSAVDDDSDNPRNMDLEIARNRWRSEGNVLFINRKDRETSFCDLRIIFFKKRGMPANGQKLFHATQRLSGRLDCTIVIGSGEVQGGKDRNNEIGWKVEAVR